VTRLSSRIVVAAGAGTGSLLNSGRMGTLLTKRRAVDLCRVATCLCRPVL
jgi:hypothetical protein